MRRAFLERHGLAYNEAMRLGEDYDLYARALSLGARMRLVPWTGYVRRDAGQFPVAQPWSQGACALEASDDQLLASGRLSRSDVATVKLHRFTTRSRIAWIDFMAAVKAARPDSALAVMLKDVRQAPYIIRGLARMIAGRFGGARKSDSRAPNPPS